MQKVYQRINWENSPSTNTAINEDNLNKIDYAIDEIDNRVVRFSKQYDSMVDSANKANTATNNANTATSKANTATVNANTASELALSAAEEANNSVEALESALEGTVINDEAVSSVTTWSSEKISELDIQTTTSTTIQGTKHGGFRLTKFVANTVQNGTPSPATPSPLLSTGDCVELVQGTRGTSNTITTNSLWVATKDFIPCKNGDSISLNYDKNTTTLRISFYDSSKTYLAKAFVDNGKVVDGVAPTNASYFTYEVADANGITPETVGKITITINGKYLGCAKTHGKNLFNGVHKGHSLNASGELITYATYTVSDYIEVKPNTPYYFSNIGGSSAVVPIVLYDENKVAITWSLVGASGPCSGTITFTRENVKYIRVSAPSNLETQVEVGTVATEYEPYKETIAWYTTQYPMIKGSTLYRENGLVKAEHKKSWIRLDGSQSGSNFAVSNDITNTLICAFIFDFKAVEDLSGGSAMCDSLPFVYSYAHDEESFYNTDSRVFFKINKSKLSALNPSGVVACLKENPIEFIIGRTTPIIETLDNESQIALNSLETFDGVTYVEFDARVQPLEFEAEVGTSQVGAYTLKALNNTESNAVKIEDAITTMLLVGA